MPKNSSSAPASPDSLAYRATTTAAVNVLCALAVSAAALVWSGRGPLGADQASRDAPAAGGLTGAAPLAKAYDLILDAQFDRARGELRQADAAPPEAREVLEATAAWWHIQLDPRSTALDAPFLRAIEPAIAHAEAWTRRDPTRAEAWFYLGGAYGARVQWRALRNERLAAARDGKRIKEALERAVALDPALDDAYFGLGLYLYYADVAPAAARLLRWLLLLPGGDRRTGLEMMQRTRDRGQILRGEADYQLHLIYLWYEKQHQQALDLLEALHARYPGNPVFALQIAQVQETYFHDLTASLQTYERLLDVARRQRVRFAEQAEIEARLGAARQLDALFETDRAIEHLRLVIAARPAVPYAALPRAYYALGAAADRLGQRDPALEAYRMAIATAPPDDPYRIADAARRGIRTAPTPAAAEAYRLSLDGWRALERGRLDVAQSALARAVALSPSDAVMRYRYGRLLEARGDGTAALAAFDAVIRARPLAPATILGASCLEAARLLERAGARDRALELYERAAGVWGAAAETRAAARQSLARLRGADKILCRLVHFGLDSDFFSSIIYILY